MLTSGLPVVYLPNIDIMSKNLAKICRLKVNSNLQTEALWLKILLGHEHCS